MRRFDANKWALENIERERFRTGTFKMAIDPETGEMARGVRGEPLWQGLGGAFLQAGAPSEAMPWDELQAYLGQSQYRMREVFEASKPYPGSGWYRYPAIEGFADEWSNWVATNKTGATGARLIREGWGLTDLSAVEALKASLHRGPGDPNGLNMYGLPVIDKETASVLRFGYTDASGEWTESHYDEIQKFLQDQFGFEIAGGKNPAKRMKALMSLRGLGNMEKDALYNVGILTQKTREEFETMGFRAEDIGQEAFDRLMKHGTDGSSMIRSSVVGKQLDLMEDKAKALLNFDPDDTSAEAVMARRRGKAMLEEINDPIRGLRAQLSRGHIFGNARIMGLNVMDLQGTQAVERLELNGQIKGDLRVISDELADVLSKNFKDADGNPIRMDVFSGTEESITREVGLGIERFDEAGNLISGRKARLFTLEAHRPHDVFLDVQSLSSFPQFFDPDELENTMFADFERLLAPPERPILQAPADLASSIQAFRAGNLSQASLRTIAEDMGLDLGDYLPDQRQPMEGIKNALYQMARDFDDRLSNPDLMPTDPRQIEAIKKAAGYVEQMQQMIDQGIDPLTRGDAMRSLLSSYRAHLTKTKRGVLLPRFRIPDAKAAGIIMDDDATVGMNLQRGTIGYNAAQGNWVMNKKTWEELVETFGGADLDDTLVNMLRMDEAGRLRSVLYRQPNALTEVAVLGVHESDDFVAETLRSKGLADIGQYDTARSEYKAATKEMRALEGRLAGIKGKVNSPHFNHQQTLQEISRIDSETRQLTSRVEELRIHAVDQREIDELRRGEQSLRQNRSELASLEQQRIVYEQRRPIEQQLELARTQVSDAQGRMSSYIQTKGNLFGKINLQNMQDLGQLVEAGTDGGEKYLIGADRRLNFYDVVKDKAHRNWGPEDIMEKLQTIINDQGQLGKYSNFRMNFDTWANAAQYDSDTYRQVAEYAQSKGMAYNFAIDAETGKYHPKFDVIRQEQAIDPSIQGTGEISFKTADTTFGQEVLEGGQVVPGVRQATLGQIQERALRQQIENMVAERAVLGDRAVGMDRWMYENRLKKAGKDLGSDRALEIFDEIKGQHNLNMSFEDLLLDMNDPRATGAVIDLRRRAGLKRLLGDEALNEDPDIARKWGGDAKAFLDDMNLPSDIAAQIETGDYGASAERLMGRFFESIDEHNMGNVPIDIDDSLESLLSKDLKVDWDSVHANMLDELLPFFEEGEGGARVLGDEGYKRIWALMSEVHSRNRGWRMLGMSGGDVSFGKAVNLAQLRAEQLRLEPEAPRYEEIEDILRKNQITEEELRKASATKRTLLGMDRLGPIDRTADTYMERVVRSSREVYERINKSHWSDLNTKSGKFVLAGVGAMIGLGMFTGRKDHTPEDVVGNPQLPGGAPYMGPTSGGFDYGYGGYTGSAGGGVTYDVQARGGDDSLASAAMSLTGASSMRSTRSDGRRISNPQNLGEEIIARIFG